MEQQRTTRGRSTLRKALLVVLAIAILVGTGFYLAQSRVSAAPGGTRAVLVDQIYDILIDTDGNGRPDTYVVVSQDSKTVIGWNDDGTITLRIKGSVNPFPDSDQP